MSIEQSNPAQRERDHDTPIALLHLSFVFAGAGVLLLGPLLPVFSAAWRLTDAQSGTLLSAQFLGLFFGAIAIGNRLRRAVVSGFACSIAGFLALTAILHAKPAHALPLGLAALFVAGLGLGQVTTAVGLLAARRHHDPRRRSSSLSLINFSWSAGAVLSPLGAGLLLRRSGPIPLLLAFPAMALLLGLVISRTREPGPASSSPSTTAPGVPVSLLLLYIATFFLYGGMENTVSGWLSTYTLRYTSLGLAGAAFSVSILWASFALSRALASILLRHAPDRLVRGIGIALAVVAALVLRGMHTGIGVDLCAILIGLGLGPTFPITLSLLVAAHARPRQAGLAMANVGLGSAAFPWLTGLVSSRSGSLHIAMLTPVAIGAVLLLLATLTTRPEASQPR